MFTGIIEKVGIIKKIEKEGTNLHFTIQSSISNELKIDQSIAHNGVCLTVVQQEKDTHTVTAIQETLDRTSLGQWTEGSKVNLERCMTANARVDGHFVQGHVDQIATCSKIEELNGSWYFHFNYKPTDQVIVEKGSITVDGTSLTLVNAAADHFSVAIIPYTYENTVFHTYQAGTIVNIEFDMIGKYITRLFEKYRTTILQ